MSIQTTTPRILILDDLIDPVSPTMQTVSGILVLAFRPSAPSIPVTQTFPGIPAGALFLAEAVLTLTLVSSGDYKAKLVGIKLGPNVPFQAVSNGPTAILNLVHNRDSYDPTDATAAAGVAFAQAVANYLNIQPACRVPIGTFEVATFTQADAPVIGTMSIQDYNTTNVVLAIETSAVTPAALAALWTVASLSSVGDTAIDAAVIIDEILAAAVFYRFLLASEFRDRFLALEATVARLENECGGCRRKHHQHKKSSSESEEEKKKCSRQSHTHRRH